MSLKRRRQEDEGEEEAANNGAAIMPKKRKGFTVGPSNLPDGTYRRKALKIKQDLIAKAKTKSAYAKIKAREHNKDNTSEHNPGDNQASSSGIASLALHPEREAMLIERQGNPEDHADRHENSPERVTARHPRRRKNRPSAFEKEVRLAEQREAERSAKMKGREERERDRRAMLKAKRPDKDGNVRLGRQSKVLLRQVEKLVSRP